MKFKIGDIVRIKSNFLELEEYKGNKLFKSGIYRLAGEVMKISFLDLDNKVYGIRHKGITYLFTENAVEDLKGSKKIDIKYFDKEMAEIGKIDKGDWIDLRVSNIKNENGTILKGFENLKYRSGDVLKFGLGIGMKLPEGYEALVAARSSTFKRYGLMLTNALGIIDNSYCGKTDEWSVEFIAFRDGLIRKYDRVCQFRIIKNQPNLIFNEVDDLGDVSRGGYGSTGHK